MSRFIDADRPKVILVNIVDVYTISILGSEVIDNLNIKTEMLNFEVRV